MRIGFSCIAIGLVVTGGCALTPDQQALLEREPSTRTGVYVTGRSVGQNSVTCRYSDGSVTHSQNMATTCF